MVEYATLKQVFCVNLVSGLETNMASSLVLEYRFSRFYIKLMASKFETADEVSDVIEMLDSYSLTRLGV